MNNFRRLLVLGSLFLTGIWHSSEGGTITVGTPGKNGGIVSWKIGNALVEINVPKNTTAAGKAVLLRAEAQKKGFKASRAGAVVTITGIKAKEIEKLKDDTNERDRVAFALPDQGKLDFHLVDVAGVLTGSDEDGSESMFSASLGFELGGSVFGAESEFLYSEIPGGDISSLLNLMYLDLQADLRFIRKV